ncbi:MAG: hypothetical protein K1X47_09780 [Cyclobacteriaceae bacterium]|nr:hypothetical protein [Cyclobacteriaceae bacterium]
MRVVREINHPSCRITIFQWNNRYIVKLESGRYEQTYKLDQFDILSEQHLEGLVSGEFMASAIRRFEEMDGDWKKALRDSENSTP